MKTKVEKQRISLEITTKDLKEIDRLAEKSKRSRSDMIRVLLEMSLDDARFLESFGFLAALNLGVNIFDKFKTALKDGDVQIENGNAKFPLS